MAGRVENAGAGIGNVGHYGHELQAVHKLHRILAAALQAECKHAAGPVRKIFPGEVMVWVVLQAAIMNPGYLIIGFQPLCDRQGILAMARHPQVQGLKAEIEEEAVHRAWY